MKKNLYCIFCCLLISNFSQAQKIYKYNRPNSNCYCEMIFEPTAISPKGVIVLDANGVNIAEFSKSNPYLKSEMFNDYNFLYINIIDQGVDDKMICYNSVINTISYVDKVSKNVFYVVIMDTLAGPIITAQNQQHYQFNTIRLNGYNFTSLLKTLNTASINKTYDIPIINEDSKETHLLKMANYQRNFDIGIFYSPVFLTGNKLTLNKISLNTFGLSLTKSFAQNHAIRISVGGAFHLPNQSSIQSGIQSKLMTAIQNNKKELLLDETLEGYVLLGGEVSYRYSFNKTNAFRPYMAIGIGSYNLNTISGGIKDTLNISNVDMSNPSSLQELLNPEDFQPSINNITLKYLSPIVEIGFEQRISLGIKFNTSIPFRYSIDQSGFNSNTFSFGLNFGLSFCLNPNKIAKKNL